MSLRCLPGKARDLTSQLAEQGEVHSYPSLPSFGSIFFRPLAAGIGENMKEVEYEHTDGTRHHWAVTALGDRYVCMDCGTTKTRKRYGED